MVPQCGAVELEAVGIGDLPQQRRVDPSRADAVDPDAPTAVVDRHRLGEHDDAALRGVVGTPALGALDPLDAGDVDDRTAAPLEHVDGGVLVHQEGALQVDVDHPVPLLRVQQVDGTPSGHTGAVDDRVESPVPGDDVGKGVAHGVLVAYVEDVVDTVGDVDGSHHRPLGGQPFDGGRTDARCSARHHRDVVVQSSHRSPPDRR